MIEEIHYDFPLPFFLQYINKLPAYFVMIMVERKFTYGNICSLVTKVLVCCILSCICALTKKELCPLKGLCCQLSRYIPFVFWSYSSFWSLFATVICFFFLKGGDFKVSNAFFSFMGKKILMMHYILCKILLIFLFFSPFCR